MNSFLEKLFGGPNSDVSYDKAKAMARSSKLSKRLALAKRRDISPEFLYFLAEDPEPEVRRFIAGNEATPRQADVLLARDQDDMVREDLAAKISKLAPGLKPDEQDRIRQLTYEALEILARDQVIRVRQVVAETLKSMIDAPPEVIGHLARDAEIVISGPVLECSPVLTDDDLIAIIEESPPDGAISAIAKRSVVRHSVSDAIYSAQDEEAIADLLGNPSAQIREETLDKILEQAPGIKTWHAPLVKRPILPPAAAERLARFVADRLLGMLVARKDLDTETSKRVRKVVEKRLHEGTATKDGMEAGREDEPKPQEKAEPKGLEKKRQMAEPKGLENKKDQEEETIKNAMADAQKLRDADALNEAMVTKAAEANETHKAIAALAVLSDYPYDAVQRVVRNQSVKGIVAVSWKAGLSPGASVILQKKLCQVSARNILEPVGGQYPLSADDMEWQLEFLGGM